MRLLLMKFKPHPKQVCPTDKKKGDTSLPFFNFKKSAYFFAAFLAAFAILTTSLIS